MAIVITPLQLNLGILPGNTVREFEYEVTNTGDTQVTVVPWASCGCTTPSVNPAVLQSGERGKLIGRFDTLGRSGLQEKALGVTYVENGEAKTATVRFIAKI